MKDLDIQTPIWKISLYEKVNSIRMIFSLWGSFIAYIKYETELDFEVKIWMDLSYPSNAANDLYILYFLFDLPADKTSEISWHIILSCFILELKVNKIYPDLN